MIVIESLLLVELLSLGIVASVTDIKAGLIFNRTLLFFLIVGAVTAASYYIFFATDLFVSYLINVSMVVLLALVLFFTHAFAGGDSKLLIVLSALYPARFYLKYNDSNYTLLFAVCFALLFGFVFLLFSSVHNLIRQKVKMSGRYIKTYLITFFKTYFLVLPYIILVNLLFRLISLYTSSVSSYFVMVACFGVAWSIHRVNIFKKWYLIGSVVAVDIILSFILKTIPFSIQPSNYLFTFLIILFQLTIRTNLYETIPSAEVKAGMILSTASTVLMQNSRVAGLPEISHEDLRDRLTAEEAASVHRWAATDKGSDTVAILRKIPFAVFITIGFIAYWIMWRVLL